MIDGLRKDSLYFRAYYLLRKPLIDMMFRGVAWDVESAAVAREKLNVRKDEIKKELDEIAGTHLYVIREHRSRELVILYSLQRDLRSEYQSIPKTDRVGRKAYKPCLDGIKDAIRECIEGGGGKVFEIGDGLSDQKIAAYLYETLKLPAFKKKRKDSGKVTVTVDDTALKKTKMRSPGHAKLIDLILEHRRCNKLCSTYLNPEKLLHPQDRRFHSHYKTFGTQTGRLSSSGDPDGYGGNSQNQDREFKWLFLPS
jgi:DNA polymerase I-like protein with 3'-5' exonuclease and polymerase domains